jgi:GDP-L-fucose synthase
MRAESLALKTHTEHDLTLQAAVQAFFAKVKPTKIYLAAAKVGETHAHNTDPADFTDQNLMV